MANFETWFDWENKEPGRLLWKVAAELFTDQGEKRRTAADDYLALYFGSTRYTVGGYQAGSFVAPEVPSFNLIQAFTDTLVSMIVRQKVRPFFLTEKGDPEIRERAQGMTRACETVMREAGLYDDLAVDICFDGHLFDAGLIKWFADSANASVAGQRVWPWEVFIPEREQRLPMPRQWFHVTSMDRGVVRAMFRGDKAAQEKIDAAQAAPWDPWIDPRPTDDQVSDMIRVVEGWHLPSGRVDRKDPRAWGRGKDGRPVTPEHDGRRVITLDVGAGDDGTIADRPWVFPYPPLAAYRPMKKPTEYWSRSVPETLCGAQIAVHRMNLRVDSIMNLHARPLLYVWNQAKVNVSKISNAYATILEGSMPAGQALQHITAQSVPAEYISRIREIIAWAKEQLGLSDQTVQANRPPGIEHAPALQFLHDLESIRHHTRFRAWESFHVQSARRIVDCIRILAEEMKERGENFELVWGDDRELKRVDWKRTDLDDSKWRLTTWPTNLLPQTPGAKLARVIELLREKIIDTDEAKLMLDFPDIQAIMGDANSLVRNIQEKLDALVKEGDVDRAMPHSYLNFRLAKNMVVERINALESEGYDQDTVDLLQRWHEDILELEKQAMAGVAPPGAPAMPPDGAAPPIPEGPPPAPEGPPPPAPMEAA